MRILCKHIAIALSIFPVVGECVDTSNKINETKLSITGYLHHSYNTAQGHVYILNNHNVVVAKENVDKFQVQSSLFTNGRMSSAKLIESMIWLMKSTSANPGFIGKARNKLQNNPIINEENFVISLTETSGMKHRFVLDSTDRNQLHILTYERIY